MSDYLAIRWHQEQADKATEMARYWTAKEQRARTPTAKLKHQTKVQLYRGIEQAHEDALRELYGVLPSDDGLSFVRKGDGSEE